MTTPFYRAVVALLDAARADTARRCAVWRCLDALQLTADEIAEVARRLDVEDRTNAAREWLGWSASITLARRLGDASNDAAREEPLCGQPPSTVGRARPRSVLRVVADAHRGRKA